MPEFRNSYKWSLYCKTVVRIVQGKLNLYDKTAEFGSSLLGLSEKEQFAWNRVHSITAEKRLEGFACIFISVSFICFYWIKYVIRTHVGFQAVSAMRSWPSVMPALHSHVRMVVSVNHCLNVSMYVAVHQDTMASTVSIWSMLVMAILVVMQGHARFLKRVDLGKQFICPMVPLSSFQSCNKILFFAMYPVHPNAGSEVKVWLGFEIVITVSLIRHIKYLMQIDEYCELMVIVCQMEPKYTSSSIYKIGMFHESN